MIFYAAGSSSEKYYKKGEFERKCRFRVGSTVRNEPDGNKGAMELTRAAATCWFSLGQLYRTVKIK
jgi:hypothetical protein